MITKVVGVTFKNPKYKVDRQEIIRKLHGSERVLLKREPKNRFDSNAVGVFVQIETKTLQIGYLKAELAGIVSDLWKEYKFNAYINELFPGSDVNNVPWGITLKITKKRINKNTGKKANKRDKRRKS